MVDKSDFVCTSCGGRTRIGCSYPNLPRRVNRLASDKRCEEDIIKWRPESTRPRIQESRGPGFEGSKGESTTPYRTSAQRSTSHTTPRQTSRTQTHLYKRRREHEGSVVAVEVMAPVTAVMVTVVAVLAALV